MTLSVEAESLAKEALKAAEDARKAQQRLQMLKKRYGMMKTPQDAATVPAVPTKPAMEVIDPTPIKKVDHHILHEEESTDPTIETRGTGSVATNDETRATGSVATNDKADDYPTMQSFINNPPPPPPPKVIRAMSPRKEERRPEPRETREEPVRVMAEPSENEREQQEEEELVVHKIVDEQKILLQVQEEITPSEPATPIEHTDDSTAATPEHSNIQTENETPVEAPKEELPQEPVAAPVVVVSAPMEPVQSTPIPEAVAAPSPAPVVVEAPKKETAAVVESKLPQSQPQEARPKVFSFYEAQTATLAVVQEGSEDSDRSQEMEQYPIQPLEPASVEPPVQQQPMQVLRAAPEPKKTELQEGAASPQMRTMVDPNQQQRRGPPTAAAAGNQPQYQRPKPAYMEAEAMLGAMLNEPRPMTSPRQRRQPPPVGKAMPEMAVSASAASSHYYSVNETLQPIDELQQRVAAIPETTDDFPIHHPYQYQDPHHHPYQYQDPHYGSYHYGDDVSVLTEHFNYGKPTSPRHINQEPPIAEEAPFREPPESRMEEGSLYGDAPERDTRFFQPQPEPQAQSYQSFQSFKQGNFHQQGNFQPPESPRFRNNAADGALGALSPRSQDPTGQLEPDQKDPRQPQIQDPPQINSRQFDSEAGRGMEPSEVRMSPLISHLRNRTEPEGKGRNHVPRPNRRVNLSVDPYSPRNPHMGDEAVSPLSASGQSTTRHYQNRAGPVGHQTPYGGYASGSPIVSNMPQMQHRYITTRSGAASVASYHRAYYPGDATVMSHQPMMMRGGSPMHNGSPVHFHSGGSFSSMPNQRTEFFHGGNVAFHEHRFVPSGGASVAHSMGGETIISVRTNARGNKVVKKLVKVEEENETDPVVAFCDMINIDKVCGIEFDEQYKVVEEELPPEPLTAADVGRNAAMGKKVFNENNYTDPFAGRHNEAGLCGLL